MVEQLRLRFTFSPFSLEASMLYWMYWVSLWKVEAISFFKKNQNIGISWKQQNPPNIPTSWCSQLFLNHHHQSTRFFHPKQVHCFFGGLNYHPSRSWLGISKLSGKIQGLDLSLPHRVHVSWWTLQGTSSRVGCIIGIFSDHITYVKLLDVTGGLSHLVPELDVGYPCYVWMYLFKREANGDWFVLRISTTLQK